MKHLWEGMGPASPGQWRPGFLPPVTVRVPRARMAGPELGQSTQDWYNRAVTCINTYDQLVQRTNNINNLAVRQQIFSQFIDQPANKDMPHYQRDAMASSINNIAAGTMGMEIFTRNFGQNQVTRCENAVSPFQAAVVAAETTYGTTTSNPPLPGAAATTVPVAAGAMPDLTIPLVAAGGAVVLAVLFTAVL